VHDVVAAREQPFERPLHAGVADRRGMLEHVDAGCQQLLVQPRDAQVRRRALLPVIGPRTRRAVRHRHVEGDLVAQHVTLHGTHRASTMPLLADVPVSNRPVSWAFIHLWRVADGQAVEHWACRDDMGLVEQVRD